MNYKTLMVSMSKGVLSWILGAVAAITLLAGSFWWLRGYINISQIGEYNSASDYGDAASTTASTAVRGGIPIAVASVRNSSVISIIEALPNGASFQALLDASKLTPKISGRGPYTVFVATDSGFAHLPPGALSAMTSEELARLVGYHIVSGTAIDLAATTATSARALSGDIIPLTQDLKDHAAQAGTAWILQEFKAHNGIVYTISAVLLPPSTTQ